MKDLISFAFILALSVFSRPVLAAEMICLSDCARVPEILAAYEEKNPIKTERDEIEYLLYRIRSSENTFIRNGNSYDSKEAEKFLRQKSAWWMMQYGEPIRTDEDFVDKLLKGSTESGRPYYIKLSNGRQYNVQTVMKNEQNLLNARQNSAR